MNDLHKAVRADGKWFRDSHGRVVILRGINAGGDSKIPPFEPFPTERSAAQIHSWGCNCVRYCTVWEGLEPEKGRYSEPYLDRMAEIVRWFTSRGMLVFIDMHQDLFSRKLGGDGAPDWAVAGDPAQLMKPLPLGEEWFLNYSSPAVMQSFHKFWTDAELQEHFLGALCRVAERFRGDPRVIGYDILNEPWAGQPPGDVEFEREQLAPFYQRAITAVRRVDAEAMLLFEPPPLASGLLMRQSRLPPLSGGNLVYAPHFYPLGALYGNEPDIPAAIGWIDKDFELIWQKAAELGTPALLGEFGVHPRQPDGERFVRGYYEMLDKHLLGGTIWTYAPRDLEWNHEGMSLVDCDLNERPFVSALVRPYAQAIAGEPLHMSFDGAERRFRLEVANRGIAAPTLIRVPRRVYPKGFGVAISDGTWEMDREGELVVWTAAPGGERHFIEITRA